MAEEQGLWILSTTIHNLKQAISELQRQAEAISEEVSSVDFEVRVRLSSALEENRLLQYQVDPLSNNGSSIADSSEF